MPQGQRRLVAGGALLLFGALTLDAVVRQRSFRAALLPGIGVAIASFGLVWKTRSTPIPPPPPSSNRYVRGYNDEILETVRLTPPLQFIKRGSQYLAVEGEELISLVEALFKAFEARYSFKNFLSISTLEKTELRERALTPDEAGQRPILRWEPKKTFSLLDSSIPEEIQRELFLQYAANDALHMAQESLDDGGELKTFFTQCPKGILAIRQLEKSPLFTAALKVGGRDHVERLIAAMESANIPFTDEERWVIRAVQDSTQFEDQDFTVLREEQREAIYKIANGFHARQLITRLQTLGMKREEFDPYRLSIRSMLAPHMDLFAVEAAMKGYFRGLHQADRLLRQDQFSSPGYRRANFERLLGADFIRSVANRLGCTRITAPRMVVVVPESLPRFSVDLSCRSCPGTVYAKNIVSSERARGVDEVVDLMRVVWHAQFSDLSQGNILTTEEGFCLVDTEFDSFRRRVTLQQLQGFADWGPRESREALLQAAEKICQETPLMVQNIPESRAYFDRHPHRKLIDIIGRVQFPTSEIFGAIDAS